MNLLLPRLRLVVLGRRRSVVLLVLVLLRRRVHVRQHQKDDGRRANHPDGDPDVASGDKDSRDSEDLTLTTEMRGKDLNIEFMFNFKPALHGGDRSVGRRRRDRLGPDCGGGAGHLGEVAMAMGERTREHVAWPSILLYRLESRDEARARRHDSSLVSVAD